ncbi:MAG: hypothetical protein WAS27_01670 [Candidatus Saccharimonadales bacterium]
MSLRTNIYIDIDGVLLADKALPALYADEFLQMVLSKYPDSTYWLTTHVWRGENVISHSLAPYLRPETQKLLSKIKPTEWGQWKTDAIDFSNPFLWFDDDLYPEEEKVLLRHGVINNWVGVDLYKEPAQLSKYISSFPLVTR